MRSPPCTWQLAAGGAFLQHRHEQQHPQRHHRPADPGRRDRPSGGTPAGQTTLIAAWYIGLTAVVLALAYLDHGIRREIGVLVIAAYAAFVVSLLAPGHAARLQPWITVATRAVVAVVLAVPRLLHGRRARPGDAQTSPVSLPAPGGRARTSMRAVHRVCQATAGRPAAMARSPYPGHRGPGWTGNPCYPAGQIRGLSDPRPGANRHSRRHRRRPWCPRGAHRAAHHRALQRAPHRAVGANRLTGLWATGLAVVLGIPDHIWGTSIHLAFLTAVAVEALANTAAAAITRALKDL